MEPSKESSGQRWGLVLARLNQKAAVLVEAALFHDRKSRKSIGPFGSLHSFECLAECSEKMGVNQGSGGRYLRRGVGGGCSLRFGSSGLSFFFRGDLLWFRRFLFLWLLFFLWFFLWFFLHFSYTNHFYLSKIKVQDQAVPFRFSSLPSTSFSSMVKVVRQLTPTSKKSCSLPEP